MQSKCPFQVLSFQIGTALLLIGCEELVFVTTFGNEFRFLVYKGNIASSQDARFFRQTLIEA